MYLIDENTDHYIETKKIKRGDSVLVFYCTDGEDLWIVSDTHFMFYFTYAGIKYVASAQVNGLYGYAQKD